MSYSGTDSLRLTILITPKQAQRFWSRVNRGPESSCWEWTAGSSARGYGRVNLSGQTYYAHRIADFLTHGPLPPGLYVCHHCDNPACCNPNHLYRGTQSRNCQDREDRGRRNRFTRDRKWDVAEAAALYDSGRTLREIAGAMGINPATCRVGLIQFGVKMRPSGWRGRSLAKGGAS